MSQTQLPSSRTKLLDAALHTFRLKGYSATTVDDLCRQAGLTKGAFFHHFPSKEDLAIAATQHFADMAHLLFSNAPFRAHSDPRDRVLGYIDFRIYILQGPICGFSCLLGTFVQETYDTHPVLRSACQQHLKEHIDFLVQDLAEAKALHCPAAPWTPTTVAYFMQSVLQGSLIFAKANQGTEIPIETLKQLRHYLEQLFRS